MRLILICELSGKQFIVYFDLTRIIVWAQIVLKLLLVTDLGVCYVQVEYYLKLSLNRRLEKCMSLFDWNVMFELAGYTCVWMHAGISLLF